MIWFAWRQFRTQTLIAAGCLVATAVVLLAAGRSLADLYHASGISTCRTNCSVLVNAFLNDTSGYGSLYELATNVLYVVPVLIGVFWGAPMIARELEAGTHRLVWNQSVTRTRWLLTKLGFAGLVAVATTGLLSLVISWFGRPFDEIGTERIDPGQFGARGFVPVAYALFAFVLGVTAGMLIRRTVPAMAATLVGYVAVLAPMPLWIRAHLLPVSHATPALDPDAIHGLTLSPRGMQVHADADIPGGWQLSNQTITPDGREFTGGADAAQHCSGSTSAQECIRWLGTQHLRLDIAYQPATHFWPLQWLESSIFVTLALALAAFCLWWTRRRLS